MCCFVMFLLKLLQRGVDLSLVILEAAVYVAIELYVLEMTTGVSALSPASVMM